MPKEKDILNAMEAAEFLGTHVETVRRLARKDEIPSFKVGKDWRFRREAIIEWADEHMNTRLSPTVLVVDDEESIQKLIGKFLDIDGYRKITALNGLEGLERLEEEKIDLVLIDLHMPQMNGADFLQELRRIDKELPVIIVTGHPESDLMRKAMAFSPFMLLAKPLEKESFLRAVRIALNGTYPRASQNK